MVKLTMGGGTGAGERKLNEESFLVRFLRFFWAADGNGGSRGGQDRLPIAITILHSFPRTIVMRACSACASCSLPIKWQSDEERKIAIVSQEGMGR